MEKLKTYLVDAAMKKMFKTKRLKLHRKYMKNGVYRIWQLDFVRWSGSQ